MKQKIKFKFGDKVHFSVNENIANGIIVGVDFRPHAEDFYEVFTPVQIENYTAWFSHAKYQNQLKKGWIK